MQNMPKYLTPLLPLLLLLGLLPACAGGNAVKLTYALGPTPAPCRSKAVIYKFEDQRPGSRLGRDSSGRTIESLSNVPDWVGWALFDELRSAGCDVKYRTSTLPEDNTPVVTGEVLELGLNQTGATTWKGNITVRILVKRDGKIVHSEKLASEVENVVLPGYGTQSDLLAETLRTLMTEVVPAVCKQL
ncbi:hypothetical protein [Pseudodesulfovibrio sp.]|uniref:hypothetical protein n=1 Tax=Pseudodesulfovibrio sp. TaxID=2035812 RepID=UPI00261C80A1|nr:hypothetical protein [Pseudodesulfovibrio sp.]MDD3311294.1 hypothetical protein [Pseudodesulfovibrio sp.]